MQKTAFGQIVSSFTRLVAKTRSIAFHSFLGLCVLVFAATCVEAKQKVKPLPDAQPMTFVLAYNWMECHRNEKCPTWIAAEGQITADTPKKLEEFLSTLGDEKPPVVFDSPGGDVDAAYKMGRMIRKTGLATAVGLTRLYGCPYTDPHCAAAVEKFGPTPASVMSETSYCFSACPLALSGGTDRLVADTALIGVHQISRIESRTKVEYMIKYKMVKGKKVEVSRKVIGKKTKTKTSTFLDKESRDELLGYFNEMGVNPVVIALMMSASPKEIALVPVSDAVQYGLATAILPAYEKPGIHMCGPNPAMGEICHRVKRLATSTSAPSSAEVRKVDVEPAATNASTAVTAP